MIIYFKLGFFSIKFINGLSRLGKKYGFDFNQNKDKKIGKLRAFVKENRIKTDI